MIDEPLILSVIEDVTTLLKKLVFSVFSPEQLEYSNLAIRKLLEVFKGYQLTANRVNNQIIPKFITTFIDNFTSTSQLDQIDLLQQLLSEQKATTSKIDELSKSFKDLEALFLNIDSQKDSDFLKDFDSYILVAKGSSRPAKSKLEVQWSKEDEMIIGNGIITIDKAHNSILLNLPSSSGPVAYPITKGLFKLLFFNPFDGKTDEASKKVLAQIPDEDVHKYVDILRRSNVDISPISHKAKILDKFIIKEEDDDADFKDFEDDDEKGGSGIKKQVNHKQPKNQAYKVKKDGTFGNVFINLPQLVAYHKLIVMDHKGTVLMNDKIDKSFVELITKRFNPKIAYSQKTIKLFNKLVQLAGLPIHHTSTKYKLLNNDDVQNRIMRIITDPNQLVQRLEILVGQVEAGNNSKDVKNELSEVTDALFKLGTINKSQHAKLWSRYLK